MKFFCAIFFLASHAGAEYRAYEFTITNPSTGKSYQVRSTLDPNQYVGYYVLNPGDTVEYVNSWMCYGRTSGFTFICNPPEASGGPAQNPGTPQIADPALQVPSK